MDYKGAAPLGVALLLALVGCATPRVDTVLLPEPRPLGKDVPSMPLPNDPTPLPTSTVDEPRGVVTLRQLLGVALLRHPELAAFAFAVRAAEARTLQAGLRPNPELALTIDDFGGTGAASGVRAAATTLQLSQLIELGGKRVMRLRLAGLERDLTGWDYEARRLMVLTEVTKAFVEVLAAEQRLALSTDLVRLAEQVLGTVVERVKAGKVSPVEETRTRVAVSTTQLQANQARNALEAARRRLAVSWGSTAPHFEGVVGTLEAVMPPPPLDQLLHLIAQNPEVARWIVEIAARQAAVAVEHSKSVPNLTVSGGVRHANDPAFTAFVAGLSLPLLLFDRNQGGVLEARYRLAQATHQRQAAAIRVAAALVDAYHTLTIAYREATTLRDDVLPASQQVFEATTEGYRQGKFGLLAVLDAQRTLFDIRGRYLEALATYHKAVAEVEQLIGEPLSAVTDAPGSQEEREKR